MAIKEHPQKGTVLLCDFTTGFVIPEMVKKRPVIVISPKISNRKGLCTVVALSTTPPDPIMPYHSQIDIYPPLPAGYQSNGLWVKGDMISTVSFQRLDLIRKGRKGNKRLYYYDVLSESQMRQVQKCVLAALGLNNLTIQGY
jgi:mRNA interferase MazF